MSTVGMKHTPAQREQRRALIARYSLKIRDRRDIAKKLAEEFPDLAVSASMVGYDIRLLEKAWKKEYVEAIETQKAKELQQLLALRETTWDCLQRSIGKNRVVIKEGKTTGKKDETGKEALTGQKVTIREEDLAGNPGLIAQLIEINKQIRSLMGLDDAQKFELTGKDGKPMEIKNGIEYNAFAAAFASVAGLENPSGDSDPKPVDPAVTEGEGLPIGQTSPVPDSSL
jgi:hypothetical protein